MIHYGAIAKSYGTIRYVVMRKDIVQNDEK